MKFRQRARRLLRARRIIPRGTRCPECGKRGPHWVGSPGETREDGFWTCPKFYGPDGYRLAP